MDGSVVIFLIAGAIAPAWVSIAPGWRCTRDKAIRQMHASTSRSPRKYLVDGKPSGGEMPYLPSDREALGVKDLER